MFVLRGFCSKWILFGTFLMTVLGHNNVPPISAKDQKTLPRIVNSLEKQTLSQDKVHEASKLNGSLPHFTRRHG